MKLLGALSLISKSLSNALPKTLPIPFLNFGQLNHCVSGLPLSPGRIERLSRKHLLQPQTGWLRPSREILVLGSFFEAMRLETNVAGFLMEQGIDIFIPSANDCNILKPEKDNRNPNKFWCEGGVTLSRIHCANRAGSRYGLCGGIR